MAKLLKLRRGTTSQHSSFTGAEGEVTVDTDKETLVVHNGSTAAGFALARADSPDSQKVRFGTGNDMEIYHNGSHSFITNSTGDLVLGYSNIYLQPVSGENGVRILANGKSELYYDNVLKLETGANGCTLK